MVVEYAKHGNLRQFLRNRRPIPDYMEVSVEPKENIHLSDLVSFAYQVSRGMEYLESKKVNIPYLKIADIRLTN